MMAKAKGRSFDAVAVMKLDRLAGSTGHLTQLAGELEALGVDGKPSGQTLESPS